MISGLGNVVPSPPPAPVSRPARPTVPVRKRILRKCGRGADERRLVRTLCGEGYGLRDVEREIDRLLHARLLELRSRRHDGSSAGRPRQAVLESLWITDAGRRALEQGGG
jgi:hypothetical protein